MIDFLDQFLNNSVRAKVLRFVLANQSQTISIPDTGTRLRIATPKISHEFKFLQKLGLLKTAKKRAGSNHQQWEINPTFIYLPQLKTFVHATAPGRRDEVFEVMKKVGKLQCVIIGGVFTDDAGASLDVLVVGEKIDERRLATALGTLENSMGKELRYAACNAEEFRYRITVNDRMVRDVIERPHEVVIDTLGLFNRVARLRVISTTVNF